MVPAKDEFVDAGEEINAELDDDHQPCVVTAEYRVETPIREAE